VLSPAIVRELIRHDRTLEQSNADNSNEQSREKKYIPPNTTCASPVHPIRHHRSHDDTLRYHTGAAPLPPNPSITAATPLRLAIKSSSPRCSERKARNSFARVNSRSVGSVVVSVWGEFTRARASDVLSVFKDVRSARSSARRTIVWGDGWLDYLATECECEGGALLRLWLV